jgi:chloramphenicol-sensitive protein RarD
MKFAFGMAMLGVCIKAGFGSHFPWIALTLAFSFCAYGVVKKTIRISATQFSVMESGVGVIPAILLACYAREQSEIALQTTDWLLLIGAGVVTGLPLFLFAIAAQQLPYSLMGMLQFIGPTLQFMCGIFIFHEPLSMAGILAFVCIWAGVGAYLLDKLHQLHKSRRIQAESYVE